MKQLFLLALIIAGECFAQTGASTINTRQTGAGAVSRSVEAALNALPVDIRAYGAVCNGADQNTAVLAALTAGNTNLYFPSGCTWILPHTQWSYTVSGVTTIVPPDSVPSNLYIAGRDWVTSVIQTAVPVSYYLMVGPGTTLVNLNLQSAGCSNYDTSLGIYVAGTTCPSGMYINGREIFTGTVNTSGSSVSWASGEKFITEAAPGSSTWTNIAININGSMYTVSSVSSQTTLSLTSSAGFLSGVSYSVSYYTLFASTSRQPLTVDLSGPGDHAGVQIRVHGSGDGFYGEIDDGGGTAYNCAVQMLGNTCYQAVKKNNGIGFEVLDDATVNSQSGTAFDRFTTNQTSGNFFSGTQRTSNFSGDAILLNMNQLGGWSTGTFTGNFARFINAGVNRFIFDSYGGMNTEALSGHYSDLDQGGGTTIMSGGNPVGHLCLTVSTQYGGCMGVDGSGTWWLQSGRVDGGGQRYRMVLQNDGGLVGIGGVPATYELEVTGTTYSSTGFYTPSTGTTAINAPLGTVSSLNSYVAGTAILNRSVCSTVQQIQYQVAASTTAVGAFSLGSDSSCDLGLYAGNGSSSTEVITFGNSGIISTLGSSGGVYILGGGGGVYMERPSNAYVQSMDFAIAGSDIAHAGGWSWGTSATSGHFRFLSGKSGGSPTTIMDFNGSTDAVTFSGALSPAGISMPTYGITAAGFNPESGSLSGAYATVTAVYSANSQYFGVPFATIQLNTTPGTGGNISNVYFTVCTTSCTNYTQINILGGVVTGF